jgi:alpha-beta hydrolase superfamily lysophospholipase
LRSGGRLAIPDLNEPAFFDLTVTRMLDQVDALAQGDDPLVLFGSSLGGFTAATWAATRPGRTAALVLLAPAFDLGPRWAGRMGAAELSRWRSSGRFAFDHHARGRARLAELDEGHELSADLPGLWRLIEPFVAPYLPQAPRPTP